MLPVMSDSSKYSDFGKEFGNTDEQVSARTSGKERKSKSRFSSLIRINLKKSFRMSSKNKAFEGGEDAGSGGAIKKTGKKSKKSKSAAKAAAVIAESSAASETVAEEGGENQSGGSIDLEEPGYAESKSESKSASVERRLSLDKMHMKLTGISDEMKDGSQRSRRATSPDIKEPIGEVGGGKNLQKELEEAENRQENESNLQVPKNSEDAELSGEDYRTPVCQSPDGSYRETKSHHRLQTINYKELSQDSPSEKSLNGGGHREISSSENSFESAFQSLAVSSDSSFQKTDRSEDEDSLMERTLKGSEEEEDDENGIRDSTVIPELDTAAPDRDPLTETVSDENTLTEDEARKDERDPSDGYVKRKLSIEESDPDLSNYDAVKNDQPIQDKSDQVFRYTESQTVVNDRRECLFKILVIGELGAGKTSIIKRYVHEFFSQNYRATIGVDFALKVLNWDTNTVVRLQLWDIAGQERFGNMTRVYYKEAVGAFIVFDVTRTATFDAVLKWKQDLDSKVQLPDGSPIPCVLLANKCDQPKEGMVNDQDRMDEFCRENKFSAWFETSAKENINIDPAARSLVSKILQNEKYRGSDNVRDGSRVNLDGRGDTNAGQGKKRFCCGS